MTAISSINIPANPTPFDRHKFQPLFSHCIPCCALCATLCCDIFIYCLAAHISRQRTKIVCCRQMHNDAHSGRSGRPGRVHTHTHTAHYRRKILPFLRREDRGAITIRRNTHDKCKRTQNRRADAAAAAGRLSRNLAYACRGAHSVAATGME